jgi:GntR family transcriptional regulator/MocR family aminotransferase
MGDPELREALAGHLGATRSVDADSDRIVVTSNIESSAELAGRILLRPDDVAVVEEPTNTLIRRAVLSSGATAAPVPVDGMGLRIDRLPAAASLCEVAPSWQLPLGGTLPLHRRLALLDWAQRTGAFVLENDHSSEFRYSGPGLPSIQGLDRGDRVVYVNSFNRLMPVGFNLGFAAFPSRLIERVAAGAEESRATPGALEQRALARFVADGHFDRYVRRLRITLAARRDALVETLNRSFGQTIVIEPADAGMHLVVRFDPAIGDVASILARAANHGVGLSSVERFRLQPVGDPRLLMFYASMPVERIQDGVRCLARALRPATEGIEPRVEAPTA